MARNLNRYYFGRLNFIPVLGSTEEKETYIVEGMRAPVTQEVRSAIWSFGDVDTLTFVDSGNGDEDEDGEGEGDGRGERYIHGTMARVQPQSDIRTLRRSDKRFTAAHVNDRVDAESRFFIHLPSLIVAFNPQGISVNGFLLRFAALLHEGHGESSIQPELQLILEQGSFREALTRFTSVTRVKIVLHPSNPDINDLWDEEDRDLKAKGVSTYKEEFISPRGTLNLDDDSRIKAKFAMASDGYGKASITGRVDGHEETVSTSNSPMTADAPNEASGAEPLAVVKSLRASLKSILSRFHHR